MGQKTLGFRAVASLWGRTWVRVSQFLQGPRDIYSGHGLAAGRPNQQDDSGSLVPRNLERDSVWLSPYGCRLSQREIPVVFLQRLIVAWMRGAARMAALVTSARERCEAVLPP